MKKTIKLLQTLIISCIIIMPLSLVWASVPFDPSEDNTTWGKMSLLSLSKQNADPIAITINVINFALIFLGVISTGLMIYAGVLYFFARDNEQQVEKAIEVIKGAIIGLALVLFSYGISYTVYYYLSLSTVQEQEKTSTEVINLGD